MHIFQTSKRRQPRRRTRRHALRSSNTDAFKMPLKRLADAFASIQISLKAKNRKPSPVHGRARQRRARVRANKNQYYIYDVKCVFGDDFLRKSAEKLAFCRAKTFVLPLFRKTGITLDTCRNFASASDPALKTAQKRQKSGGDRLPCGRRRLNLQREKL